MWIRKMEFMAFRPCPADRNAGKTYLQALFATRSNGSTTLDCSLRMCCYCALKTTGHHFAPDLPGACLPNPMSAAG